MDPVGHLGLTGLPGAKQEPQLALGCTVPVVAVHASVEAGPVVALGGIGERVLVFLHAARGPPQTGAKDEGRTARAGSHLVQRVHEGHEHALAVEAAKVLPAITVPDLGAGPSVELLNGRAWVKDLNHPLFVPHVTASRG